MLRTLDTGRIPVSYFAEKTECLTFKTLCIMKVYSLLSSLTDGSGFTKDVIAANSIVEAINYANECNQGYEVYSATVIDDIEYTGASTNPKMIYGI